MFTQEIHVCLLERTVNLLLFVNTVLQAFVHPSTRACGPWTRRRQTRCDPKIGCNSRPQSQRPTEEHLSTKGWGFRSENYIIQRVALNTIIFAVMFLSQDGKGRWSKICDLHGIWPQSTRMRNLTPALQVFIPIKHGSSTRVEPYMINKEI